MALREDTRVRCFRCGAWGEGDVVIDVTRGDVVCRKCGEVQNIRVIDTQDEVRQFLDDDSNKKRESRTSGLPEEGKLTGASSRTQFVSGIGGVKNEYTASLNRSIELTATVEDRTSLALAAKINEITQSLNVTDNITRQAEALLKRVVDRQSEAFYSTTQSSGRRVATLKKGQVPLLSAGAVYLACRQQGYGRTLEEVSLASGVAKGPLSKAATAIIQDLNLVLAPVTPADVLGRIATSARFPSQLVAHARHVCERLSTFGLLQTSAPQLVAGVVLLLVAIAARETVDVASVARATLSCAPAQLKRGYAQLRPHVASLLPPALIAVYGDLTLLPAVLPDRVERAPPAVVTRKRAASAGSDGAEPPSKAKPIDNNNNNRNTNKKA